MSELARRIAEALEGILARMPATVKRDLGTGCGRASCMSQFIELDGQLQKIEKRKDALQARVDEARDLLERTTIDSHHDPLCSWIRDLNHKEDEDTSTCDCARADIYAWLEKTK